METDDAKKEEKKEGEKKEGESSSSASGATSAPSMVVGEELNEMVKNIMGSDNPTLHRQFLPLLTLEIPCSEIIFSRISCRS